MAAARPVSICSIKNQVLIMLLFYLDEFIIHFFYTQVLKLYGTTPPLMVSCGSLEEWIREKSLKADAKYISKHPERYKK